MQILFIGGTGNISTWCSRLSIVAGHSLAVLTRGKRPVEIPGVEVIQADINDEAATTRILSGRTFDVVINFIAFTVEQVERDLRLFTGRCGQYIFISSASCYTKPMPLPVVESSPLGNPLWDYSQRKVACENRLWQAQESGFNVTVVRPSHTYDTIIPFGVAGGDWSGCARLLAGKPMVLPGDGTSIWTVTHSQDVAHGIVGLCGNAQAYGEAVHITGDELLTWEGIHREIAAALGVEAILVPMTSEAIVRIFPDKRGGLLGDKSHSAIFDNSKIKRLVPTYCQKIFFAEGIRRTLAWFQADPSRQKVSSQLDEQLDALLAAHAAGAK